MRRLVLLAGAIVFVDTSFYAVVAPLLPSYAEQFDLSKTGAGILAAGCAGRRCCAPCGS